MALVRLLLWVFLCQFLVGLVATVFLLSFWFSGRWRALAKGTAWAIFIVQFTIIIIITVVLLLCCVLW